MNHGPTYDIFYRSLLILQYKDKIDILQMWRRHFLFYFNQMPIRAKIVNNWWNWNIFTKIKKLDTIIKYHKSLDFLYQ